MQDSLGLRDLVDPENKPQRYLRSFIGECKATVSKDKSFICYQLNKKSPEKRLRIDLFEFKKQGKHQSKGHGVGSSEYIFVESGKLTLSYEEKEFQLKSGDIFEFKAEFPHAYVQESPSLASGFIVIFPV